MKASIYRLACVAVLSWGMSCPSDGAPVENLPGLGDRVSWVNGEQLRYEISWGLVRAAQVTYTAHVNQKQGDGWDLQMEIKTEGNVEKIYPVQATGRSLQQVQPWRSLQLTDQREQNRKKKDELTVIQYTQQQGRLTDRITSQTKTFPVVLPAVQDLVSVFYGLRTLEWKEGVQRRFAVYENAEVKPAEAIYVGREKVVSVVTHQPIPCVVLWVHQLEDGAKKEGKGLGAKIWMSEGPTPRPLKAELKLRYVTLKCELKEEGVQAIEIPAP